MKLIWIDTGKDDQATGSAVHALDATVRARPIGVRFASLTKV